MWFSLWLSKSQTSLSNICFQDYKMKVQSFLYLPFQPKFLENPGMLGTCIGAECLGYPGDAFGGKLSCEQLAIANLKQIDHLLCCFLFSTFFFVFSVFLYLSFFIFHSFFFFFFTFFFFTITLCHVISKRPSLSSSVFPTYFSSNIYQGMKENHHSVQFRVIWQFLAFESVPKWWKKCVNYWMNK